jgi:lysophospholipase L1-like esterase
MNQSVQLDLKSGGHAELLLDDPDESPSSYFVSMEHSGNGEFWRLAVSILSEASRSVCRIGAALNALGLTRRDLTNSSMKKLLQTQGYAFGVFRDFEPAFSDLDAEGRKTFLFFRDPRDVVVRAYTAWRAITEEGSSAQALPNSAGCMADFLRSRDFESIAIRYRRLTDFARTALNTTIFRYEDCAFTWRSVGSELIRKMELPLSRSSAQAIADSVPSLSDVPPTEPKDGRTWESTLDDASLAYVEEKFADSMTFLGYALESPSAAFAERQPEFLRAISARLRSVNSQCSELVSQVRKLEGMKDKLSGRRMQPLPGRQIERTAEVMHTHAERDPVLLWRLRPNSASEAIMLGRRVRMEVDSSGCRLVVGQLQTGDKTLAVYGCSLTFGWGINADETFCSLLQADLPKWRIENHGVGGYSSLQNLIQLQRDIRWSAPDYVTFCWIPSHLIRNVGDPAWLQSLMKRQKTTARPKPSSDRNAQFPCASLDANGRLEIRSVGFPRRDLMGIDLDDLAYGSHYLDLVCAAIYKRAAEIAWENGAHFFATTLLDPLSPQLQRMLDEAGIPVVDACVRGKEFTLLPDDGHPNAAANRIYAERIRGYLSLRQSNSVARKSSFKEDIEPTFQYEPSQALVSAEAAGMVPQQKGCTEPDPALLWRLKPHGSFEMKVLGRRVVMDIDSIGCRPVLGQPQVGEKTFAAYGCSMTYGWAISAGETFCSLLQSMFPTWRVENHGVSGYSSTQNLIQLQRESRWDTTDYVTFCWNNHHLLRNVADFSWLQRIMSWRGKFQSEEWTGPEKTFPRASLDRRGKLQIRPVKFPREDLVGIDWADFSPDAYYLDLVCFGVFRQANEIVRVQGGHFFVTTLRGHLSPHLQDLLRNAGIPVLDASLQGDEYTCLPDDAHPNALANRIYAEKIRDYLLRCGTSKPKPRRSRQSPKRTTQ